MASKLGMAGGIPERRVRPIWDAVDSRQYKAALKLCAALLPKYPNSPYAIALKALVLERMGKLDEALSVCLNAREQLLCSDISHMDDLTLSTLQMVLQRLNRLDLATSCYEHACGKYPNNLELMMGLFNCYVREYSYVKQQQTAIKMYKIVGEEKFLLWAVCSIQLQVSCDNAGDKLLPLAEALLKKHASAYSLHEPEALLVYISILERQAKYGAALEIISGSLGSLLPMEADKYRIQGRLLARAGDYAAAVDIFLKALELCPDDWELFLQYLGCLLEDQHMSWLEETASVVFKGKDSHLPEDAFEERIASASSFAKKLQSKVDGGIIRGPYLAIIEIEKRRRLYGRSDGGRLMEAFEDYFCRFSHLSCFMSDIEMFVDVLNHGEKEELLEKFMKTAESSSLTPLQALGQTVAIFRIKELFGLTALQSVCELKKASFELVDTFCKKLYLSRDLDPQENIHGEELLTTASNALVQLCWRTRDISYLVEAIMVLEFGITIGRHAWQFKILLLHLYSHLGALPLAYERYGTMDVKNILLETMSHHILPQMMKSLLWDGLSGMIREYLRFMDDYMREAADHTFVAYRHRNYTKAVEFVLFKKKLQNSAQYLLAKVEASILELKQKADNLEQVESVLESSEFGAKLLRLSDEEKLKSLTFNEDLHSRPWWSPSLEVNILLEPYDENFRPQRNSQEDVSQELTRRFIKRRSLIPRLLFLSIHDATSSVNEKVNVNSSHEEGGDRISSELENLLEQYSATFGQHLEEAAETVVAVSEQRKPLEDLASDLPGWLTFAVFLNSFNLRRGRTNMLTWSTVDNLFRRCIRERLTSPSEAKPALISSAVDLPIVVQLITEAFSFHGVIIQAFLRSTQQPSVGKRKKKTGGPTDQPSCHVIRPTIEVLRALLLEVKRWADVRVSTTTLDATLAIVGSGEVLRRIEIAGGRTDEVGERISSALQSWDSADVARKMVQSQRNALTEVQRICDVKLKRLESMS